jgi:translocation and assembly module TamA
MRTLSVTMASHQRATGWIACLIALLFAHCSMAASVKIEIEGLEEELRDAARSSLALQRFSSREMTPTQVQRLFAQGDEQIRQALQPYGYYAATVKSNLRQGDKPDQFVATFAVELGPPVIVESADVRVAGEASELPEVRLALEQFAPRLGERLDHSTYEASKSAINSQLQAAGFFDAKLERRRVEVTQATNTAHIDLLWDSHERYRFGDVHFSDVQFPDDFLRRYVPWEEGDYYSATDLLTLQQRLVDADYFSVVSVQPDMDKAGDGIAPIEAVLVPAKRTVYTAGVYMSTDSGPGVRLGVDRRWLNKRGHKLGGEIQYSSRLQQVGVNYRIPKPGDPMQNYNFSAGYRDEETDTSRSRMARLSASEVTDNWHDFVRTLSLQYLHGDFEIADEQQSTSLLYAEGLLTRKRADDLLFPRRGLSLLYGVRLAAEQALSDTSLAQIRAEGKWIRPMGKSGRFLARASLGAMIVDDFNALPPELRFFAGGDRSVRGFDYQAIGEVNDQGGVIGGKFLTVASAEYEHYFLDNWGAAVFVDAGDAYSTEFNVNVGAGIGLRWRSPVGLLRLDFAVPVVSDLENGLRIHIVIGPDL